MASSACTPSPTGTRTFIRCSAKTRATASFTASLAAVLHAISGLCIHSKLRLLCSRRRAQSFLRHSLKPRLLKLREPSSRLPSRRRFAPSLPPLPARCVPRSYNTLGSLYSDASALGFNIHELLRHRQDLVTYSVDAANTFRVFPATQPASPALGYAHRATQASGPLHMSVAPATPVVAPLAPPPSASPPTSEAEQRVLIAEAKTRALTAELERLKLQQASSGVELVATLEGIYCTRYRHSARVQFVNAPAPLSPHALAWRWTARECRSPSTGD